MAPAHTSEAENPLLAAALAYAARGIPVFPLVPRDKLPVIPKTEGGRGFKDATTDPATIRKWWRRWPHANIGTPTGYELVDEETGEIIGLASQRIIMDIDPRNGGDYDAVEREHGRLPTTATVHTGGNGLHLHYAYPVGHGHRIKSQDKFAPGVEIKAHGKYVILPPSKHPSGNEYEWENECEPAPLPAWLLKCVTEEPAPIKRPQPLRARGRPVTQAHADDRDAYWLAWACARSGQGTGDETGYLLAQQLLLDPNVRDGDGVLLAYAQQATLDPSDPFDERSIDRWLSSASRSNLVIRGEPAKAKTKARDKVTPMRQRPAPQPKSEGTSALKVDGNGEPPSDELLLRGEADDNGNAECMWRLYGHEFLYTPAYGWLRWVGTHWRDVPEPIVAQCAIKTLKKRRVAAVEAEREAIVKATKCQKERVNGCMTLFKSYVIEPNVAVFDADPDLLNCQNGVLDLRSGKLAPHDHAQRFTYCVPVEYDPTADQAHWEQFVLSALGGDAQAAAFMHLCAGYALTGHTREEKMFYLYGPPRSGKGTFTETLLELLPHPLSTEVDFSSFTAQRDNDSQNFDLADLKPARIVIASESNRYQSLNPAKIKSLTGGNLVRCAFKHKDMFTYRPQFKVWLVSNHTVTADADDEALWGRVLVFTFPVSHLGTEDVTLKERMKSPANLRGVLAWAVAGAMAWHRQPHLEPPETINEATREHRDAQDFTAQWVSECCTLDADEWMAYAALRSSYENWCERNGTKPVRSNDLADALVKRFGCTPKRQPGTGARGYKGIRLGVTSVTA